VEYGKAEQGSDKPAAVVNYNIKMDDAKKSYVKELTKNLKNLLTKAVEKSCTEEKIGVILSAGIDSTIIAQLASRFSEVTAYSVGAAADSHDLEFAGRLSECVDFKINIVEINADDVFDAVKAIIKVTKNPNAVKVSVGVPFYIASKHAASDGIKVMLCGQGPDELFGGYNRYIERIKEDGCYDHRNISEMMRKDVENVYESQLKNDAAICASNGVELRFPFMDEDFRDYAMQIPVELKIYEVPGSEDAEFSCVDEIAGKKFIRKFILRKVAQDIGIPDFIINRQKKAAQYGSGANKILDKIARNSGFKSKAREKGRNDYVNVFLEDLLAQTKI
jgi:asparagine synthase (glutamine-hydrolysing)